MGNDDITRILEAMSPAELQELIDNVVSSYNYPSRYTENIELRNHILFLEHAQNYLLLKYAIKYADIGLLRRSIARCCVYFHASGQHKYAYEMLYLQRLIATEAAAPTLQRAILANGLVNLEGADDSWFEIDRLVEIHNGTLKMIFNHRRGSAITVQYLMEKCALNSTFFRAIVEEMESFFSVGSSNEHSVGSAQLDISLMARDLFISKSITGHQRHTVEHKAIDLFDAAIPKAAGESLCKFNAKECHSNLSRTAGNFVPDEDEENDDASSNIRNYFTANPVSLEDSDLFGGPP
jgi:hypothetical protein